MSTFLSILPIIIALVLYFTGIPIAYALFAAALTYFGFIDTTTVPYLLMQKFITSTQSFPRSRSRSLRSRFSSCAARS